VDFENGSRRDLSQFLDHLTALEEKGLLSGGEQLGGAVTIMSIHKSKGLEFPVVFLCGLSRRFNRESARAQVLCDKDLGLGLSCVDIKNRVRYPTISKRAIAVKTIAESLSEELRVLYVAMTRAKDRLIMTYASDGLEKDAAELALRMDFSHPELLTGGVSCPGEWVLMEALRHTEAGELFALGARPAETTLGQPPWQIVVAAAEADEAQVTQTEELHLLPADTVEQLRQSLGFKYPYGAATVTPSKQTATQIKGREKDQESAENAQPAPTHSRHWRKPSFRGHVLDGRDYGTALHTAMQYIRYENCTDLENIRKEVGRLVAQHLLTPQQGEILDLEKLHRFFRTEIGRKLCAGKNVLREFKFSIFEDADESGELAGEKILLQGVIDCALMEDDGITVLDFKTDFVTDDTIARKREQYRPQVEAYARALERIFERKIKEKYLYFFHLDRFEKL
jgi:ATP-dependent helicase/nuclease subunit A